MKFEDLRPKKFTQCGQMTVEELEGFYKDRELPRGPVKINKYATIIDPATFVEAEFYILHQNTDSKSHDSCRLRLIEFKHWLETNAQ
jgi:hypothetical protein